MTSTAPYINTTSAFRPREDAPLIDQVLRHVNDAAPSSSLHPLRFAVFRSSPDELHIEATYSRFARPLSHDLDCASWRPNTAVVSHIVPTSVGATIGGFAGDASPATRLLAQVSDTVITNPNAVNASDILSVAANTLYVEGSLLDRFFLGLCGLGRVAYNQLGVIIEKQPQRFIDYVRYSIDAAAATCGIPVVGFSVTPRKIGPRVHKFPSGAYTGILDDPEALLESAESLVSRGATAIAITSEILDLPDLSGYVRGLDPNPHGAVEALISHTVTSSFGVPSAHAPMWGETSPGEDPVYEEYDPREAAELVTQTAIGCVLQGLHKAPQAAPLLGRAGIGVADVISVTDLLAIVLPARAVGNIPALCCERLGITIIGVEENATLHDVRAHDLRLRRYLRASNYLEAAGAIAALRAGLTVASLRRPISNIGRVE